MLLPLCLYAGEDDSFYFYRPQISYGSEAFFSPATTFLNGSLDILRNGSHENNGESKSLRHLDYSTGIRNVWNSVRHPFAGIEEYGWRQFVAQEIFPIAPSRKRTQYVPNYAHHVLGAGMIYTKTAEWFSYRGYSYPRLWSFAVTQSYQFMNEVLENNHFRGPNVDAIADLLIFNPLGYLLFSFDGVNRFFSNSFRLYDWSLQPVLNPFNLEMENAGQQFAAKFGLPFFEKWEGFFYWGINGIAGLSYSLSHSDHLSFGAGTEINRLEENRNRTKNTRFLSPITDGAIGIFYDRNHSLLASMVLTMPRFYNARINIYPGVFDIGDFQTGFYLAAGELDGLKFGLTWVSLPVGLVGGGK